MNGLWYCIRQVIPHKEVAFLAVSNIGSDENGKGKAACDRVIETLRERHFQS